MTSPSHAEARAILTRYFSETWPERAAVLEYIDGAEQASRELAELRLAFGPYDTGPGGDDFTLAFGPYDTGPGGDDFTCAKHQWSALAPCPTCTTIQNAKIAAFVRAQAGSLRVALNLAIDGSASSIAKAQHRKVLDALAELLK